METTRPVPLRAVRKHLQERSAGYLGCPGFPVEGADVAIFMRFSQQKTADAALFGAANRKSGLRSL